MAGAQEAQPRGLLARLRRHAGPLLPRRLRMAARRLLDMLLARGGSVYDVAGHRLRFLPGSEPVVVASRSSDERARHEARQLEMFAALIKTGDVVADVGAHRGTYTVVAAARVGPAGKVYAFEPTAQSAAQLERNLDINHLRSRVTVERLAISDVTGITELHAWGDSSSNSLVLPPANAARVAVPSSTLDDYFRARGLPRVLKIDVEGAEIMVLRGATRLLASEAEILCELHPYAWPAAGSGTEELRSLLRSCNRYAAELETACEIDEFTYGAVLLRRR